MIFDRPPRFLWEYIDSEGEELLWWGQPDTAPMINRTLQPILTLVKFIIVGLLLWACVVVFREVTVTSSVVGSEVVDDALIGVKKSFWLIFTAGVFYLFGLWMKYKFRFEIRNDVYYIISNQRVQTVRHNSKYPDKSVREFAGRGDIFNPSLQPVDQDRYNLIFYEAPGNFGMVQPTPTDDPVPRRSIIWKGFEALNAKAAKDAYDIIQQLLRRSEKAICEAYGFSIDVPAGWTLHTLNVSSERRDDVLLNVLMADVIDAHGYVKLPKILDEWNTAILTKRLPAKLESERGTLPVMTIVVETTIREGLPEGIEKFAVKDLIALDREVNNRMYFQRGLIHNMYVCQFRRGYRISQELIDNLRMMENKHGEKVVPDYVLTNLNYFKDWETAEKKVFDSIIDKAITTRISPMLRREILKRIENLGASNLPCTQTADGKLALLLNPRSQPADVHAALAEGRMLDSEISIAGKAYKMRQLYGYRRSSDRKGALHMRISFFGQQTIFDENVKIMENLARSIEWH